MDWLCPTIPLIFTFAGSVGAVVGVGVGVGVGDAVGVGVEIVNENGVLEGSGVREGDFLEFITDEV